MSTKRIPIHRPIRAQIPLEALNLFREMRMAEVRFDDSALLERAVL